MAIKKIGFSEFHEFIRAEERASNAGATSRYYPRRDITVWHIAGRVVAVSVGRIGEGRRAYFVEERAAALAAEADDESAED